MIKQHLQTCLTVWPDQLLIKFLVDHGRDYAIGPDSFALPRGTPQACYSNATHLAAENPDLTYVEGKATIHGIPIDHAWCVDADGVVIDPTVDRALNGDGMERIGNYFGVPFRTDYVRKATLMNKTYGLLDGYHARKTLPKLIELGLEAGQQWLLDGHANERRK